MTTIWKSLQILDLLAPNFRPKQDAPVIPDGIGAMARHVTDYEGEIRNVWAEAKEDIVRRGEPAVEDFIERLVELAYEKWEPAVLDILGLDILTPSQERIFLDELETHIAYMRDSLGPELLRRLQEDYDDRSLMERLVALDHRIIAMYAGALWSAGSLLFAMFDGIQARDMAALFMFAGPDDENTCRGPRGCHQYANRIFPLAQILAEKIIPGQLQCLTNCRHILLPIVRVPADEERPDFEREIIERLEAEGLILKGE